MTGLNMSDNKNFILLLEKISEIGERTVRMEVNQENMKEDLEEVKRQDIHQNKLLDEHIRGVQTAQARLDNEIQARKLMEEQQGLLKSRVDLLETGPKFRATLKQYLIGIGGVAGAMVAIFKLLKYLGM